MRRFILTAALLLVASGASAWQSSSGPSLGEIAERTKKEREAKRAGKPAPRVITDADLKSHSFVPSDSAADATPATPAPGAAGSKAEKTDDQVRAEKRQEIEKKIADQRETQAIVHKAMADAQRELNDPTTATTFGTRGAAMQKILDDGLVELKKTEQAIADLEEEARRQGIAVSRP
jgi:hypothetical protein